MRPLVIKASAAPQGQGGSQAAKGSVSAAMQGAQDAHILTRSILEVLEHVALGASDLKPNEEDTLRMGIKILPGLLKNVLAAAGTAAPAPQPVAPSGSFRRASSGSALYSQPPPVEEQEIPQPARIRNDDWREQPTDWMAQKRGSVVQPAQQMPSSPRYEAPAPQQVASQGDWRSQPADWFQTKGRGSNMSNVPVQAYQEIAAPPAPTRAVPYQEMASSAAPTRASMVPAAPPPAQAPPGGMSWMDNLKTKKEREEYARRRAEEEDYFANEAKWDGVPDWKRKLLQEKDRKREESEQPAREMERLQREAQERFNSLPAWKQKLLLDKAAS